MCEKDCVKMKQQSALMGFLLVFIRVMTSTDLS